MNFNSIITKIVFIFVISIFLFISLFFAYHFYETNNQFKTIHKVYADISKQIRDNRLRPYEIKELLTAKNFKDEDGRAIFEKYKPKPIGAGPGFDIFNIKDERYLHLHSPHFRLLFKDNNIYPINYYGYYILAFIFIVFVLGFTWIIKALLPLKDLKLKIEEFSKGNLNIDCKSDKKDEIADVANEFDNAVKEISLLLESRQLFLRTVMHELKTPIAKGRIVSELIDNEKQKNRMATIFDKLNFLINDFAKIEQIVSKNYNANIALYYLEDILEHSFEMLMLDNKDEKIIIKNIDSIKLSVDIDLIAMAIKNLLDNGIKYSNDHKVRIEQNNNELLFISKSSKLSKSLEEYFQPFHNDTRSKNHGMGLGLYIVYSILTIHNMRLEYSYDEENNIFKIIF